MSYDKFLLFGDSITQFSNTLQNGFALQPALQDLYVRKLDIINRGFSGYSSEHARVILPKILESEANIKLMTIFFGTNDSFDHINDIQTVELPRYKENIDYLITLAKSKDIKSIVVGPSLHDPRMCLEFFAEGGRQYTKDPNNNQRLYEYSEAAKEVAKKHNVPFIDLWNIFRETKGWTKEELFEVSIAKDNWSIGEDGLKTFLSDGIHFTGESYKILYNEIIKRIDENYPELKSDNLSINFSDWKDINPKDLSSIFK
ncbi:IAH1 Isoamyl acetate-hydrolyzing esterase [Candida maltosa Xu316]|uniref:Isoamyl acetate-hydrolyzing esterase, putative n=1 Tax=Candida maltosa (strain Xu316) TaxID=1245528 RepID=M3J465_CANMX|nr:Isoamyl acetate-hydrolyzing esterase, putative [Candida maltosa Xu316]